MVQRLSTNLFNILFCGQMIKIIVFSIQFVGYSNDDQRLIVVYQKNVADFWDGLNDWVA